MADLSPQKDEKIREVEGLLAGIESATLSEAWALCRRVNGLPDSYQHTVEAFREGLRSSTGLVQMVSANGIVRFAAQESWALPELEAFLLREERDVLSASIALQALQSLGSCDAARVIAAAVPRIMDAPIRLSDKAAIITYALRSLGAMGGIALNEGSAFRQAVRFFDSRFEGLWAAECFWELEYFIEQSQADLVELSQKRKLMPLATVALSGSQLLDLPHSGVPLNGPWSAAMDEYCSFDTTALPARLIPDGAKEGEFLPRARVVVLQNQIGERAVILCSDEACTIQEPTSPEAVLAAMGRFIDLDPTGTHTFIYKLGATAPLPYGSLTLCETPSIFISSPSELFGGQLGEIQRLLFAGCTVPSCVPSAIEAMRRDQRQS